MVNNFAPLGFVDSSLNLGSHLCCFYEDEAEQLGVLMPFFIEGLRRKERCVSISDESLEIEIKAGLSRSFNFTSLVDEGNLVLLRIDKVFQRSLNPDRMIKALNNIVLQSIESGWEVVRMAVEWDWILQKIKDRTRWLELEAKLNLHLMALPAIMICQYNVERISARLMVGIMRTHPFVVLGGTLYENPYFIESEGFLKAHNIPYEVIH